MGTVGYMSPEQVRGHVAGPASDLFSLGAVLYESLTGKRAFRGDTAADTMSAILREDPPEILETNRQVPPALDRIIRHCLEKNAEERFQSARDIAFNLEALSSTSTIISPAAFTPVARKSRLAAFSALGLGIVAACVAGGFLFASRGRPAPPIYHRLTFRQGTVQNARFAPDGQTIVYSASWDGDAADVFTTRPQGPDSRTLGLKGSTLLSVSRTGELAVMMGAHALEGGAPREVQSNVQNAEWSPDGTALLVVHQVGGIDHMEFPPGKLISQGGAINHPRFSPRGDHIAFFDYPSHLNQDGAVVVTDFQDNKTVLSKGWADLTGLAWSADASEIWFTGDRDNGSVGLFAVDLKGHERLVQRIPADLLLFDVAPDGRVLLGREDWRGGVYALGPGDARERDLSWFDFSFAEDISADGTYFLFGEEGESSGGVVSYLRKIDGSPAVRLYNGPCGALSSDAERLICVGGDNQLHEVPTRTGDTRMLTHDHLIHLVTSWLPGQNQFLFSGQEPERGQKIYVQDIASGDAHPITPDGARSFASVSPDGSSLAISMGADYQTYIVPIKGGDLKLVPGMDPGCLPVAWSADNRFLYCYRMGDVPLNILRVELSTGRSTPWKQLMPTDPVGITYLTDLHFSSDMKSYVYDFQRKMDALYVVEGLH